MAIDEKVLIERIVNSIGKEITRAFSTIDEWNAYRTGCAYKQNQIIDIVNKLAEEHNNGWIPCEVDLPKIPNSYLVTKMCENDGNPIYDTAHEIFWTTDKKWDCERDEYCEWKVIAWQNKLAPYKGEQK